MSSPRARLFVALDLPASVRAALDRWGREELGGQAALRLIPADNLHVTLCFLGWREEHEVEPIAALTAACAAPVRGLSLAAPAWLPTGRPRLLAVDVADPGGQLAALQRRVSDALARRAGYRPERRPYRPHVTVARVRSGAGLRAAERPRPPAPRARSFDGAALTLYRSRLARQGARYEPAARVALGKGRPAD